MSNIALNTTEKKKEEVLASIAVKSLPTFFPAYLPEQKQSLMPVHQWA